MATSILATKTFTDVNIEMELNLQRSEAFNCASVASGSFSSQLKGGLTLINSEIYSANTCLFH